MKKKVLAAILCVAMVASMMIGCTTKSPASGGDDKKDDGKGGKKIGITIQNYENAYWAGVMSKLEQILKDEGYDATIVGCEENSAKQIEQIENFITSGCDLIMVHPNDADAVEEVCGRALDEGIKVMCWDNPMENTTANWVLDNTELGKEIGKTAAAFINEHYTADNKAQVCVIGKPDTQVLLERQNGIEAGLKENCKDNYEIVATIDGVVNNEVQSKAETVLQANPDCKVWVGVGAGAMIGSNTALLAKYGGAGKIPEDCGVITTDVTSDQLNSLEAGDEAVRAIVGFEGSNTDTAQACFEMFKRILDGEDFSADKNVYRPTMEINDENIAEIQKGM
ncbi:MAG: sugar ABC transporter substrate-binding protein [Lachnospiraceae bacterium]